MAATKFYSTSAGDFFQVVRETKTTVTIRPVESECLGTTTVYTAFDYDVKRKAKENAFTTSYLLTDTQNRNGKRCKVSDGTICINSAWSVYAYASDGIDEFNRNLG